MEAAYSTEELRRHSILDHAHRWFKSKIITEDQLVKIETEYKTEVYHPHFFIRLLLFLATLMALGGITGITAVFLLAAEVNIEQAYQVLALLYGLAAFVALELLVIDKMKHYRSGVTEAVLYHAFGYTFFGIVSWNVDSVFLLIAVCFVLTTFMAFRYLDWLSTAVSVLSLLGLLFYTLYQAGGILQQLIPIAVLLVFGGLYLVIRKIKDRDSSYPWREVLLIAEVLSLLIAYVGVNYFVVRELSVELMGLQITEDGDIPLAWLFYILTAVLPMIYLYVGIKTKDVVLIRVSLLLLAFAVFTFKYYFSLGHPEISLTIGGAILLGIAIAVLHYLRIPRHGFTREKLLHDERMGANLEAVIITNTMGGNAAPEGRNFGGGEFGGGGAQGSY